ncbi:hypothetical protein [Kitasatospora aureofaciens]|uniref:hypothetical protein n=1 Tax=Kitasatospora aureofaciens TaxID=1894 RepID=UPI0033F9DCB0
MQYSKPLTEADATRLGENVGRIAAWTAKAMHESYPHLRLEMLLDHFTRDHSLEMLSTVYLRGLESGLTPGDAAAEAGAQLVHTWAKAALETRAEIARERAEREALIDRMLADDEVETEATGGCPACDTQAIEMCAACGSCRCDTHENCIRPA